MNEAAFPKSTKMAAKFGLTVFNGKLFNLSKLKILCARKGIAQWDFHFLLCKFVDLDRLIIQWWLYIDYSVWYILKQLFTSVLLEVVHTHHALFTSTSVKYLKLLNLAGRTVEYGPLNWPITAPALTVRLQHLFTSLLVLNSTSPTYFCTHL